MRRIIYILLVTTCLLTTGCQREYTYQQRLDYYEFMCKQTQDVPTLVKDFTNEMRILRNLGRFEDLRSSKARAVRSQLNDLTAELLKRREAIKKMKSQDADAYLKEGSLHFLDSNCRMLIDEIPLMLEKLETGATTIMNSFNADAARFEFKRDQVRRDAQLLNLCADIFRKTYRLSPKDLAARGL